VLDARNHYPQIKHHTPPPKQGNNTPIPPNGDTTRNPGHGPVVSKPNSVSDGHPHPHPKQGKNRRCFSACRAPEPETHYRPGPSNESLHSPNPHTMWAGRSLVVLLRKEVIQPHLPVRLPCYDFVPIADPTFDGSLPEGLGHRLRVLPTFMT
jgi:hypothetical protein